MKTPWIIKRFPEIFAPIPLNIQKRRLLRGLLLYLYDIISWLKSPNTPSHQVFTLSNACITKPHFTQEWEKWKIKAQTRMKELQCPIRNSSRRISKSFWRFAPFVKSFLKNVLTHWSVIHRPLNFSWKTVSKFHRNVTSCTFNRIYHNTSPVRRLRHQPFPKSQKPPQNNLKCAFSVIYLTKNEVL